MFYVGQKVVCINPVHLLEKDKVYTVTYIDICGKCKLEALCVGIKEDFPSSIGACSACGNIEHLSGIKKEECSYKPSRFAPLEEYSDSMSIAMQLVQEIDQTDKQKIFNPKRETVKN